MDTGFNDFLDSPLWGIEAFGRENHPAGKTYWWDNGRRVRDGRAVVQLAVAGSILVRDAAGDRPVPPGSLIVFCYGDPIHYGQPDPLVEHHACRWVAFRGAGLAEHLRALTARHGPILQPGLDHPLADQLERLIVLADPQRPASPTRLAESIHHFVMSLHDFAENRLWRELSPAEQAIRAVLQQPNHPWSIKEIAARYQVSREHFSRLFQQRVGRSAHAFLTEARQRRALALLKQTRLPLPEIARQSGYANAHTLARHVRDATGRSPTAYREQAGS